MTAEVLPNPEFLLEELIEIYSEDTSWVSQNDIDNLQSQLSEEDFATLSSTLGWEQTGGFNNAA